MLQEHGPAAAPHHGPPDSIFTGIWKAVKETVSFEGKMTVDQVVQTMKGASK